MTLPGETLATGADPICDECGVKVELKVCHSGAGYYIGAWCDCGPYCRESIYYPTQAEAQARFLNHTWMRRP